VDAATLAERLRTALGAESLAEPLPPVSVEIVPPAPPAGTVDPVDPTDPEDPR
jgi:coenzyme F420-0:L-glutamate ligase/coenzyme F420-1:gamma-L-glutamate ligase